MIEKSDKKILKWILIVFAVAVAVMAVGIFIYNNFLYDASTNPLEERSSFWEEDTYTNTALELRFTMPEGWVRLDRETLLKTVGDMAGVDTEEIPAPLVAVLDPENFTTVTLTATYGAMPPKNEMKAGVEQAARQLAGDSDYEVAYLDSVELAGLTWETYRIDFADLEAEEYLLFAPKGKYMAAISTMGYKTVTAISLSDLFTSTVP